MQDLIDCKELHSLDKTTSLEIVRSGFGGLRHAPPTGIFEVSAKTMVAVDWWEWTERSTVAGSHIGAWFEQMFRQALIAMSDCIECTPNRMGGIPVLRDSRLSVSQILAELADSEAIVEIADNFEVDEEQVRKFVHALAIYFNRPLVK